MRPKQECASCIKGETPSIAASPRCLRPQFPNSPTLVLAEKLPILIRTKDGRVFSIAGVGTMPKMASAELFRNRRILAGELLALEPGGLKGIIPVAGLMPALVPGMVEAGLVALEEFGTMSFSDVIAPALDLTDGMPLDETRANSIVRSRRFFDLWPTSKAAFLPSGQMPIAGDIFRQPDLNRTLRGMVAAEQAALKKGPHGRMRLRLCTTSSIKGTSRERSMPSAKRMAACFAMRTWRPSV